MSNRPLKWEKMEATRKATLKGNSLLKCSMARRTRTPAKKRS